MAAIIVPPSIQRLFDRDVEAGARRGAILDRDDPQHG
jgi:hypothetical protein